jgi:hypothetical protein
LSTSDKPKSSYPEKGIGLILLPRNIEVLISVFQR